MGAAVPMPYVASEAFSNASASVRAISSYAPMELRRTLPQRPDVALCEVRRGAARSGSKKVFLKPLLENFWKNMVIKSSCKQLSYS